MCWGGGAGAAGNETRANDAVQNPAEAALIVVLVAGLLAAGVEPAEIGVISPYRAQLRVIGAALQDRLGAAATGVEVHTVDKFQGRDKGVILFSLVRSNPQREAGGLLRDW